MFTKNSGTQNGGTEPYNANLGVGFPVHKHCRQLKKSQDPSILGTNEMFGEMS